LAPVCSHAFGPEWGAHLLTLSAERKVSRQSGSNRRNKFIFQAANAARWGQRGDFAMTDIDRWKERRQQLLRYCAMERESTDPLAIGLIHDIVLEIQADLLSGGASEQVRLDPDRSG
jgi:hypothetical protein